MAEHDMDLGVPEILQAEQRRARYIAQAMARAKYKALEDGTVFGEIPGFQGVWANAATAAASRTQLRSVLDGWLTLRLNWHDPIPVVDGIDWTHPVMPSCRPSARLSNEN